LLSGSLSVTGSLPSVTVGAGSTTCVLGVCP
jgi:hypothetical protein